MWRVVFRPQLNHVDAMNEMPAKLKDRAARKTAKREEKKRQIAECAIEALKELGYANTSLRDIAERSDQSLGMLHYYFEDRTDLIIYCVEVYKREFVRDILEALDDAEGRQSVIEAFSKALTASIIDDAMFHRLWYDIRTQAMFDASFRPSVAEIEAMLINIVHTALTKAGHVDPQNVDLSYALLDGAFRYIMQGQIGDTPRDRETMTQIFAGLLDRML